MPVSNGKLYLGSIQVSGGGSGSLTITENGTYDIEQYAEVIVNIPSGNPVEQIILQPQLFIMEE